MNTTVRDPPMEESTMVQKKLPINDKQSNYNRYSV